MNPDTSAPSPPLSPRPRPDRNQTPSIKLWALPLALTALSLLALTLAKEAGAPSWLLKFLLLTQIVFSFWSLLATAIWIFHVIRAAFLPPETSSASGRIRFWVFLMIMSFVVAGSVKQAVGLPQWLRLVLGSFCAAVAVMAYWRMEKISDAVADELTMLIRRQAGRFAITGVLLVGMGAEILNQAGVIPEIRWKFFNLAFLVIGIYMLGMAVISRRYR